MKILEVGDGKTYASIAEAHSAVTPSGDIIIVRVYILGDNKYKEFEQWQS